MDDGDVIKLLDYQIRNSYGNVFWTHKIHEKDADMYNKYDSRLKVAQIILSAVSTTGLISVLLGILWILYKKKHILPYVSCLAIGVWIAVLKGYTIFYFLMTLFS